MASSADRGSPLVPVRVVLDLLLDVASTPFHLIAFVATRGRHHARFARMLAASATSPTRERRAADGHAPDETP